VLSFKNDKDRGFSLPELIAVIIIIGIIAALAAPSLIGLLSRNRVNDALWEIEAAIKEAQRQAMRQGKSCQININDVTNIINANPTNCLLSDREIDDNLTIRTNLAGSPPNIIFSPKGSNTKMGTIVVSSDLTNHQKCFVISLGLGITRTGDYVGLKTGAVSYSNCQKTQ
jgi:prepilin-type N-terminal cleavage/methylation domain-containing protein